MIKYMKRIWLGSLLSISIICCAIAAACDNKPMAALEEWPKKLDAPTNFRVEDRVLVWDEVEHAQGYAFTILGIDGETTDNYFDLSTFPYYAPFEVELCSLGDGLDYLDSDRVVYPCQLIDPLTDYIFELTNDETGYRVVLHGEMGYHKDMYIPDEYEGLPVTEIKRRGAPPYRSEVQSVRLPASLKKIGAGAFEGFFSLQGIEFPEGLESIGGNAFYGCSYIRAAYFPSTLQTIGESAFANCNRLMIAEFTSAVKIGSSAFNGCVSLMKVNFAEGITIGLSAFANCTAIRQLYFAKNVSIGQTAFQGCTLLEEIDCAEGVTLGGSLFSTFQGCTAFKRADVSKCSRIGAYAFSNCSALTDIVFPEDPSVYVSGAFLGTGWYLNQPDGYVIVNGDTLFQYKGEIPNDGVIDDFPAQIKKIGGWAFTNLNPLITQGSNLVSIEIPDGVQLCGKEIFYNCKSLQAVRLPSDLTTIPTDAFYGCDALESIEIPASVRVIGKSAFSGCEALTSVVIPEGVTKIGDFAFGWCESLTEISLPSTLEEIGSSAFTNCKSLTEISLPFGLKTVGASAFVGCSSLTKLHFPDSIQTSNLISIASTVKEVILPVSMNNIDWFGAETIVYYRGSKERWKADFPNVRGGVWYFYVEDEADLPADGGNYWHFAPDGKTPIIW